MLWSRLTAAHGMLLSDFSPFGLWVVVAVRSKCNLGSALEVSPIFEGHWNTRVPAGHKTKQATSPAVNRDRGPKSWFLLQVLLFHALVLQSPNATP